MKLAAAIFATLLSVAASASVPLSAPSQAPKTYAVFLATYNPATGETVGGVAGSAFFITPKKAITAFHVLQAKSFDNPNTQIWLVHENEPAIELAKENLISDSKLDRTTINLIGESAPQRFIFSSPGSAPAQLSPGTRVETDGFLANSTGPILEFNGAPNVNVPTPTSSSNVIAIVKRSPALRISSVPHLARLHSEGSILRQARIELASNDVNLKNAPCVQVSYKPVVGLSGGPVFSGDRLIGMNSFADPEARSSTWAIALSTN